MVAMNVSSRSNSSSSDSIVSCDMESTLTTTINASSCRSSTCPPWLQAALADIEQRVKALSLDRAGEDEKKPDSFAERAENYYQKRPQLLSLLHDLHHRYLCLADRYSQSLCKPNHRLSIDTLIADFDDYQHDCLTSSSDAESTLSFQIPREDIELGGVLDSVVAQLVGAFVERELVLHELCEAERRGAESARKSELQGSLLEVLESERLVLLSENARLGLQAAAAEEEARGLAAEVGYVRRRAGELARCVVKLREDHRVCLLGRKIEVLRAQIYALERRNKECYEAMARREIEKGEAKIEMDKLHAENLHLREQAAAAAAKYQRRKTRKVPGVGNSWWSRVRSMDWAICGSYVPKGKGGDYWYC